MKESWFILFKCENCRVQKNIGDTVYLVESASCILLPTCSKECAEIIKEREIEKLQSRIDKIKNTEIKKESWWL